MTGQGKPKFRPGRLLITPAASRAIDEDEVLAAVRRHVNGDWGDVDEHDRAENERSLCEGFRLLSSYASVRGTRFWVLTEADRSATTILLPEDY